MRNLVDLILILLIIAVLLVLNAQFGWINIEWESLAIGGAAGAGPIQYLRNKAREKVEEKENAEMKYKYRVLEHRKFVAREQSLGRGNITIDTNDQTNQSDSTAEPESFFNANAVG